MALLMKNGIAYAKSDKIYTRVFKKEVYGGQSAVIFTDELIVPDSTVKFYSSDKDMVLISKKITGHTLKAIVYSTKITHNVKVEVSTPHSSVNPICYGYRMNSSINNPDNCITYLEDAENMTPAAMNFSTGVFNYGSWKNAFFMPRPCMLNYDGTVAYYLDENDYSKKEDGTPSDVSNVNFPGNAMVEWGKNGQQIWYKIVPDNNNTKSANIYIANMKLDNDYEAWSFYDINGHLTNHFYTSIYDSCVDSALRVRSISGLNKNDYWYSEPEVLRAWTTQEVVEHCELNNINNSKCWYSSQLCDSILITLLTVLITKSNDSQAKIGVGCIDNPNRAQTGLLNDKGMFFGSSTNATGVKVFGMENFLIAPEPLFIAGYVNDNSIYKYKLTRSDRDGSGLTDYNFDSLNDYLIGPNYPRNNNWGKPIINMTYTRYMFFPTEIDYQNTGRYAGDCVAMDKPEITYGTILMHATWSGLNYSTQYGMYAIMTKGFEQYNTFLSCKPKRK